MALDLISFSTRDAASVAVANSAACALQNAVVAGGRASLMVSGGTTPLRAFEALAILPVDWAHVTVGLIDERWVAPDHPDSNERLVRTHLIKGRAQGAGFLPMRTDAATHRDAAGDRSAAYAPFCQPVSFALLGMGLDGHTASWFPGADGLADVFAPTDGRFVAAVDAPGALVSQRMTLTGPAVVSAAEAALLVFGDAKRTVLEASQGADPLQCPIRFAIEGLGNRLAVYWAP